MKEKDNNLMTLITDTVNLAQKVHELYLKRGPYPELSATEIHVIEAVSTEEFPTMGHIAQKLNVTVGTLTTNVKPIIKKGFLTKEKYKEDKRYIILSITDEGYKALEYHKGYHKELTSYFSQQLDPQQYEWVKNIFTLVESSLLDYRKILKEKN